MLRALTRDAPPRILSALEPVTLRRGEVVHDDLSRAEHVWMPVGCVLSARVTMSDGASLEAALHGEEGFVGFSMTLGTSQDMPYHARVVALRGGLAWRLPVPLFREAMDACAGVRVAFLALQAALGAEMLGRAICNRHHRIDRQLCRWLMLYRDRACSDDLCCTQQELADILGVRREGITEALGHLAAAGALALRRGGLCIVDPARVAAGACSCYRSGDERRFNATETKPTAMKASDSPAALRSAAG